jgi:GNAT superfamily N-acetyltransferase
MADLEIVPLAGPTWPALLALFEKGGDPSRCWCAFWRLTATDSSRMSTAQNRAWLEAQAQGASDIPAGLVAQQDGIAVGWVSLAPREDFKRLARSRGIPMIDGDNVWSVTCFVVDRSVRGHGLSAVLLNAALGFATGHGAGTIEAYPLAMPADTRIPPAAAYTGVESTFLGAGFRRLSETTSTAGGLPRVIVRRDC